MFFVRCEALFLGDMKICLLTAARELMMDQSIDITKVQIGDPLSLFGLFAKLWVRVYLQ